MDAKAKALLLVVANLCCNTNMQFTNAESADGTIIKEKSLQPVEGALDLPAKELSHLMMEEYANTLVIIPAGEKSVTLAPNWRFVLKVSEQEESRSWMFRVNKGNKMYFNLEIKFKASRLFRTVKYMTDRYPYKASQVNVFVSGKEVLLPGHQVYLFLEIVHDRTEYPFTTNKIAAAYIAKFREQSAAIQDSKQTMTYDERVTKFENLLKRGWVSIVDRETMNLAWWCHNRVDPVSGLPRKILAQPEENYGKGKGESGNEAFRENWRIKQPELDQLVRHGFGARSATPTISYASVAKIGAGGSKLSETTANSATSSTSTATSAISFASAVKGPDESNRMKTPATSPKKISYAAAANSGAHPPQPANSD